MASLLRFYVAVATITATLDDGSKFSSITYLVFDSIYRRVRSTQLRVPVSSQKKIYIWLAGLLW